MTTRKGMCKKCVYRHKEGTKGFCIKYQSWCQLVARNCLGEVRITSEQKKEIKDGLERAEKESWEMSMGG